MEGLVSRGLTACLMKATIAAGTTSTLSSTATCYFSIEGKAYSHAALSNTATPTTDVNTAAAFVPVTASNGCAFVVGFNAAGDLKCAQGALVALTTETDGDLANFMTPPQFPALPTDFCPIGYILTKVGASGSTWTFGTSNLTGPPSNVKHIFVDVTTLPTRPQVS
jgi:hypothetical protein